MKIGFDAKRAFFNSSGLGNYSRNTLNALYRFFPENKYILFTPEVKEKFFENFHQFQIITPKSLLAKKFKSLWRSLFLVSQIKQNRVDVFHGLSNELPKRIHKSGIPSVVTIHDIVFMRYPEFYQTIDRKIYYRKVRYACAASDKIIAISQQTQNDIETFFHVPPEKIELIYQPVSSVFFEKQNEKVLKNYEVSQNFILSVGTLEPRKNQLVLLKALHFAGIRMPVVFVGKPTSYLNELQQFASENGMEKQIFYLSNIQETELAALYQRATLSVYISVFEGFGLPVIESMASGCPVLTSTTSVLPETAGGAAVLCNPASVEDIAEKLTFVLENVTLRNEMKEKGRKRANEFRPEIYARKLVSLYTNIIKDKHAERSSKIR